MESNESNRQYGERTVDSVQIGLRVPKPFRDGIRALARANGRAMTAEFEALIADGQNFRAMMRGPMRDLLLDLFVGARMSADLSGPSAPLVILDSMRKHYAPDDLIAALDNFRERLA
jgi:hypothetical protein